jgi:hypothetical protein
VIVKERGTIEGPVPPIYQMIYLAISLLFSSNIQNLGVEVNSMSSFLLSKFADVLLKKWALKG